MSDQRVTISIEDHVADVRFNRPDKINALDGEQFAAIVDAGEELKGNLDVRAVVVSGNGRGLLRRARLQQLPADGRWRRR